MVDVKLKSFKYIDTSNLRWPVIVVYNSPKDYPGKIVARVFELDKPTNAVVFAKSLDKMRKKIMVAYPWMARTTRHPDDEKTVVEVWI